MSVREDMLTAVREGRVQYKRKRTGDQDQSRFYKYVWLLDGTEAGGHAGQGNARHNQLNFLLETDAIRMATAFPGMGEAAVEVVAP